MGHDQYGKLTFEPTYQHWVEFHDGEIQRYLDECVEWYSREYVRVLFNEFPQLAQIVTEDFVTNSDDITYNPWRVTDFASKEGNEVNVVSGSRGSGKTSFSVSLIEAIHEANGATPAFCGQPNKELESHGWKWCVNLGELEKDDYALYDEAALFLNARRAMSSTTVDVLSYIPTLRHKEVDGIVFLTQSTKKSDVGLIDWCNAFFVKDYSDAFGTEVERSRISDDMVLEFMMPRPNYVVPSSIKSWTFCKTSKFKALMKMSQVSWYSDKVGKAYGLLDEGTALRFAVEMIEHDLPLTQIRDIMKLRAPEEFDHNIKWWKDFSNQILENGGFQRPGDEESSEQARAITSEVKTVIDNEEHIEYAEKAASGKITEKQESKPKKSKKK